MQKILLFIVVFVVFAPVAFSQSVNVLYDNSSPQALYAAEMLEKSFLEQGYLLQEEQADYMIRFTIDARNLSSEAYTILPEGKKITVTGGDGNGLIYGSLSLAEDLRNGIPLQHVKARSESPDLPFRAIKFNLPWDPYRPGYAKELHRDTCRDVNFWESFLDMMAENRFNVLSLWNLHPFTYMIKPRNFPEASPWNAQEMKEWQDLYSTIFRMAKERGIDTYIVFWNIYVSPEFAKAHNVAVNNLHHFSHSQGDTSEIIKRYTREAVTQVLEEYPDLSGIGFYQGESMHGLSYQQKQDWLKETVLEGIRLADRKSKLIYRASPSANVEAEQTTRKAIEALDFLEGPIWTEIKFNWSHAHSTPELVIAQGGKLSDTYFKPEPKNYKIVWMARNEDFFALRWGVPDFIREHLAINAQDSYVGGYFVGSEGYIPAKDYFTAIEAPVDWTYAFERQWLFYKLWGRLLYNSSTPDDVFRAEFIRRYGKESGPLLEAYEHAGTVPLRLASSFGFTWDLTLYSEGFMALNNRRLKYISVDRRINTSPVDPDYVSVIDYVETHLSGGFFEEHRVTPPVLARMLEKDSQEALRLVENINTTGNASLMYEVADVKVWANLGLHFAEKLKGAVALQTYRIEEGEEHKRSAVEHLEKALGFWDEVIAITRPIYNDMPLVYSEPNITDNENTRSRIDRFHWEKLRPEVARDIEIARNATVISRK